MQQNLKLALTDRKNIWNKRHSNQPSGLQPPHQFLSENIRYFQPGSVIDMACGLGHNAVFLANQGFEVCAVDFSSVALAQLGSTCTANDLKMELLELDLTSPHSFASIPKADNIVVLRYKLKMEMMEHIPKLLNKNGVFLYCTFNQQHHQQTGFPSKHCLTPNELTTIPWDMKLLCYNSFTWDNAHFDGYVFKKS